MSYTFAVYSVTFYDNYTCVNIDLLLIIKHKKLAYIYSYSVARSIAYWNEFVETSRNGFKDVQYFNILPHFG
ncbi:hypothetical protein C1646_818225 [Rhizophagus diaphanus]|nr:hypothetical protein C1646_818225 [Rhizophagus diaphanus] [Rhizophagus sp. MUCL 43196]